MSEFVSLKTVVNSTIGLNILLRQLKGGVAKLVGGPFRWNFKQRHAYGPAYIYARQCYSLTVSVEDAKLNGLSYTGCQKHCACLHLLYHRNGEKLT